MRTIKTEHVFVCGITLMRAPPSFLLFTLMHPPGFLLLHYSWTGSGRISWTHLRSGDVFLVGWRDFLQLGDESSQHTAVIAGHGCTRRERGGGEGSMVVPRGNTQMYTHLLSVG